MVNHAIAETEALYGTFEYTCCIYATAPFIRASDIRQGFDIMSSETFDFVFTAATFPHPIQRAFKQTNRGIELFDQSHLYARSQDLEEAFHDAGQFYWGKTRSFLANLAPLSSRSKPLILPRYRVHDIDTEEDWMCANIAFDVLSRQAAIDK